jgi:AraC-like DNA-binding protein
MDALAHLLGDVRADGALFGQTVMRPPWSVRVADRAALTVVVPVQGVTWAHPGDGGEPVPVGVGDVAIVVGAAPFTLADSALPPERPRYAIDEAGPCACTGDDGAVVRADLRRGVRTCAEPGDPEGPPGDADDDAAVVLTGSYRVTGRVSQRLLGALPRLVVVRDWGEACPLMEVTFAEVGRAKPGQQAVLDRLLDLLLLTTLREWFDREAEPPGWYRAMGDPIVGAALRLLHDAPERPWTVATLAAEVGASRATLARRFADLVGEPPMTYLTSWRLSLAADLLERTDLSIDAIARRVGYVSGYSLSVAFKRVLGLRPGHHRTTHRAA